MRIAVAQVPPAPDREAALALARELAAAASAAGAAFLVLPQRFASGMAEDEAAIMAAAEASDGPSSIGLRTVAAKCGLAVLYGYVERCTGVNYDSLQLIDGEGRALANYRRTHLERGRELALFGRGQWLSCMPLGGRRLGLLSGYDVEFPEPARALRLIGCDLLVVAGGAGADANRTQLLLAARAAENHCQLAFVSAAPALPAMVLDPAGRPLARAAPGTALVTADLGAAPAKAAALLDRRPRLYHRITAVTPAEADTPL